MAILSLLPNDQITCYEGEKMIKRKSPVTLPQRINHPNSHLHETFESTEYHSLSQSIPSRQNNMANVVSGMHGVVNLSVSRSSVVFDGTHTHVESEEQTFSNGRWDQQKIEGVWAGDQSHEAIQQLTKTSKLASRLRQPPLPSRPLPRGRK
jgi:hypothetical protein